jgi:hypothetical protein
MRRRVVSRRRRTLTLHRNPLVITLRLKDTNQLIGTIADADLQFLIDELEEESLEDTDYYIDAATIDMLEDDGAPASLVTLLRTALGTSDGVEVRWSRE